MRGSRVGPVLMARMLAHVAFQPLPTAAGSWQRRGWATRARVLPIGAPVPLCVQIVLFDGFDPLDVVAPFEVLSAGGSASGGALVVELFNALIHTRDGWTAVVPGGLILSVVAAILAVGAVATLFRIPVRWVAHREVRA